VLELSQYDIVDLIGKKTTYITIKKNEGWNWWKNNEIKKNEKKKEKSGFN